MDYLGALSESPLMWVVANQEPAFNRSLPDAVHAAHAACLRQLQLRRPGGEAGQPSPQQQRNSPPDVLGDGGGTHGGVGVERRVCFDRLR
jgi:hypothetical protein